MAQLFKLCSDSQKVHSNLSTTMFRQEVTSFIYLKVHLTITIPCLIRIENYYSILHKFVKILWKTWCPFNSPLIKDPREFSNLFQGEVGTNEEELLWEKFHGKKFDHRNSEVKTFASQEFYKTLKFQLILYVRVINFFDLDSHNSPLSLLANPRTFKSFKIPKLFIPNTLTQILQLKPPQ